MTSRPSRSESLPAVDRPLDGVASIKVKIALLVALSILTAVVMMQVGRNAGVPWWLTLPVTLAAALGVTQWLARGMTSPLREMTSAAGRMATGDYSTRISATSADEVGALARAFNTMSQDLATSDEQRRQVVATVSHELRTPLAAQRALLENLVDGVVKPSDAALQTALAQSERLSTLVTDLLDVSRLDEGATQLALGDVQVSELLTAAVAEASMGARGVQIEARVEPPDLLVRGDEARIAQIVVNLLDNAVRHSPVESVVRVLARAEADAQWSLEVSDEGPGFPPGQQEHLFARFGVGDDSSGGTGLGLAIARWVAQLHGGTIAALPPSTEPTTHRGGRVRALLPTDPTTSAPPVASPYPDPEIPTARQEQLMPTHAATHLPAPPTTTTTTTTKALVSPTQPPSVVEALFGPFWPEAGPRVAPVALWACIGVGALAAAVLPYRNNGIGTLLVLLTAGGLVLWLSVRRREAWTLLSAVLCVGLASLIVLRAAEWLTVLALLVAAVLVTTALTGARGLPGIITGAVSWLLSGIRGLPLLGRTLSATSRTPMLWPVVRTAAISLVALVVFGGLFASGDAVFGSWVSGLLPTIELADSLVLRTFVWFLVAGVVLAACYLALNPPRVELAALPQPRQVTRPWEWLVPVGVVVATFVGFLLAQASTMWGGHDWVQRTTGMTYAESVHQGFGQLTVATALTLVTIAIAARKAPRATPADRLVLRIVLGALCLLTLVVVASALYRMSLYQEAYGFTVLRVLVDAFELWLGLLVVLVAIAGIRLRGWWLPRAALASAAAMLLTIGLANPDAWVAQRNIDRFEATGRLDVSYLSTLGADAVPVIKQGLPADLAACALGWRPDDQLVDDALAWNLGRTRALDALAWIENAHGPYPSTCVDEVAP
ncbi:MAG: DUF4173 domain-containing protein [Ornithinimicrobium sp.]|uniref:DUF4153 domain-containing protein n=1 Tax=Ornithinimicrobium sp. TaxID=1977084 RepID=UPI0026DFE501|nr:DUF4153 domain-containing protein [Ornithinimicrobium sp.]MDO5739044.1 DUF4173 domain-containing protein [Ornithinimicrobium sp.]